ASRRPDAPPNSRSHPPRTGGHLRHCVTRVLTSTPIRTAPHDQATQHRKAGTAMTNATTTTLGADAPMPPRFRCSPPQSTPTPPPNRWSPTPLRHARAHKHSQTDSTTRPGDTTSEGGHSDDERNDNNARR